MKQTLPLLLLASGLGLLAACSTAPSANSTRYAKTRSPAPSDTLSVAAQAPAPSPATTRVTTPAVIVAPAVVAPAAPPVVVSTPPPTAPTEPIVVLPPPAPVLEPGTLKALRKGGLVRVYWALPVSANGYRAIEIMRNTQEQAAGRARIRALRASITEIEDTVPDIQANYWYWLKVTHADGTIQNIGPISSPPRS